VIAPRFGFVGSRLNLERIELSPLFTIDDRMFFAAVEGRRTVAAPSFRLYPANVNHARRGGNPFAGFQRRWYR
jgi:hypothetical protein